MRLPKHFNELSPFGGLAVLFVLGLLARLAVTIFIADNRTLYFEHMLIAQNLLTGHGYSWDEWGRAVLQPTSLVLPFYVYWCAFFQWLSPLNFLPMYAAQALVAASGIFPAFRVGQKWHSDRVGWLFAGLYAFYPETVFMHSKAVAESILLVAVLWMLDKYLTLRREPPGTRRAYILAVQVGLIAAIGIYFKETAAIVAAAICISLVMQKRPLRVVSRSYLLPIILTCGLALAPWLIRNTVVQQTIVPLRTAYGINFWISNVPESVGNDRTPDGRNVLEVLTPEYNAQMKQVLPFDEQDREWAYLGEAWRLIKENPAGYVTHCAHRLLYWVWFVPAHALAGNPLYRAAWITVLLLGSTGLFVLWRERRLDAVIPLTLIGFILLYVPVIVLPRYRAVTALLLLFGVAVTLDRLWTRSQHRRSIRLAAPLSSTKCEDASL